jgi:hypothetical protein
VISILQFHQETELKSGSVDQRQYEGLSKFSVIQEKNPSPPKSSEMVGERES